MTTIEELRETIRKMTDVEKRKLWREMNKALAR